MTTVTPGVVLRLGRRRSAMCTVDDIGVLYRSGLVKFALKKHMATSDNPIIRQFIAGRAKGTIGMDELAVERSAIEQELIDREERRVADVRVDGDELAVVRPRRPA